MDKPKKRLTPKKMHAFRAMTATLREMAGTGPKPTPGNPKNVRARLAKKY